MPMITFYCDRRIPGTSCIPMLTSLGLASEGFNVTYVRCEADESPTPPMMPQNLDGVDVVLASFVSRGGGHRATLPPPIHAVPDWPAHSPAGFTVFDAPLDLDANAAGSQDDELVSFVARSLDLRSCRAAKGPKILYCGYDGLHRGETRRRWDDSLNGLRLDLPVLSAVEIGSLLCGAPLVRARFVAFELAAELVDATVADGASSPFAWPSASLRPGHRHLRYSETSLPR